MITSIYTAVEMGTGVFDRYFTERTELRFSFRAEYSGTGKSNFLQLFENLSANAPKLEKHYNHPDLPQNVTILHDYGRKDSVEALPDLSTRANLAPELEQIRIFRINPEKIGMKR